MSCGALELQRNPNYPFQRTEEPSEVDPPVTAEEANDIEEEEEFLDAEDIEAFEAAPPNTDINFEEMAENYFARVDEIHRHFSEEEDEVLDFEDLSSEEEEADQTPILESILRESMEPLFQVQKHQVTIQHYSHVLVHACSPSAIIAWTRF